MKKLGFILLFLLAFIGIFAIVFTLYIRQNYIVNWVPPTGVSEPAQETITSNPDQKGVQVNATANQTSTTTPKDEIPASNGTVEPVEGTKNPTPVLNTSPSSKDTYTKNGYSCTRNAHGETCQKIQTSPRYPAPYTTQ